MNSILQAVTFSRIKYSGLNEVLEFQPGRLAAGFVYVALGVGAALLSPKIPFLKKELTDESEQGV